MADGIAELAARQFLAGRFDDAADCYARADGVKGAEYAGTVARMCVNPALAFDRIDDFTTLTAEYLETIADEHAEDSAALDESTAVMMVDEAMLHAMVLVREMAGVVFDLHRSGRIGGTVLVRCLRCLWDAGLYLEGLIGRTLTDIASGGSSDDGVADMFHGVLQAFMVHANNLMAMGELVLDDGQRAWMEQVLAQCPVVDGYGVYTIFVDTTPDASDEWVDQRRTSFGLDVSLRDIEVWNQGMVDEDVDMALRRDLSGPLARFDESLEEFKWNPLNRADEGYDKLSQASGAFLGALDGQVGAPVAHWAVTHVVDSLVAVYVAVDRTLGSFYVRNGAVTDESTGLQVRSLYGSMAQNLQRVTAMLEYYVMLFPDLRGDLERLVDVVDQACTRAAQPYADASGRPVFRAARLMEDNGKIIVSCKLELARLGTMRRFEFDGIAR